MVGVSRAGNATLPPPTLAAADAAAAPPCRPHSAHHAVLQRCSRLGRLLQERLDMIWRRRSPAGTAASPPDCRCPARLSRPPPPCRHSDDGSGRQRWKLAPHASGVGVTIQVPHAQPTPCAAASPCAHRMRRHAHRRNSAVTTPAPVVLAVGRACPGGTHLSLLPPRRPRVLQHLGGAGPHCLHRMGLYVHRDWILHSVGTGGFRSLLAISPPRLHTAPCLITRLRTAACSLERLAASGTWASRPIARRPLQPCTP